MTRAPWPLQRLGAALADVAVAADDGDLAADQDVGAAVDAVDEGMAAAVLVVELRLGHRVVDVDRREEQLAVALHLVEPMDAGRRLLGDAADAVGDRRPPAGVLGQAPRSAARGRPSSLRESAVAGSGTAPAFSNSTPWWTRRVASPPSSRIIVGPPSPGQRSACSVHHQYSSRRLALPGEHRHPPGIVGGAVRTDRDRGGRVVLGREDVAARPADLGAEGGRASRSAPRSAPSCAATR